MSTATNELVPPVPANIEAEEAVLGALLIDSNAILTVSPRLRPEDFYVERHAWIYQAMLNLQEKGGGIDILTLAEELRKAGRLEEVGGLGYLAALASRVPSSIHVEYYAELVERTAILRRLIEAATEIARMAYKGEGEVAEIIDQAEQLIFAISSEQEHRALRPIEHVMKDLINHLEDLQALEGEFLGVPTGLTLLDELLGGLQKSDLILLAARPGVGKTSLALTIALNAVLRYKKHVAFFSLEMSAEQLAMRLLSMLSRIDAQKLRLGKLDAQAWDRLMNAASLLSETDLYIDDTPAASVMEIRSKARRLHAEARIDLVIIDYIQLMQGGIRTENRVQEISHISRSLKALAREMNVPVLALSQLSRGVEQRQNKRPILSDLRESGSLEQDADVVMFLYRDAYYNPDTPHPNLAEIRVAKHRHGPTDTIHVHFDAAYTSFRDLNIQSVSLNESNPPPDEV